MLVPNAKLRSQVVPKGEQATAQPSANQARRVIPSGQRGRSFYEQLFWQPIKPCLQISSFFFTNVATLVVNDK